MLYKISVIRVIPVTSTIKGVNNTEVFYVSLSMSVKISLKYFLFPGLIITQECIVTPNFWPRIINVLFSHSPK